MLEDINELQGLKTLKVAFNHAKKDEVVIHTIRLPKRSTVGDVITDLKTKIELSRPNAEVRLLEIFSHKIYKIFPLGEKIEYLNDTYWTLRAEEIPEEEEEIDPQDRLIHVYHFMKDTPRRRKSHKGIERISHHTQVQNFGKPFLLVIHEGETLAEIKARVQNKLQVPDEDFSKRNTCAWDQYLGLEHSDNPPKRSHSANQAHEFALGHGPQVIEVSVDTESHNTELASGHGTSTVEKKGIACICTSSSLKIINLEDAAPPVDYPESWRGFPVGKDHASLLHDSEQEHPDFFNDVKYSSAKRAIQSLNLFASNLANLASDKSEHLSRDDLRAMRDELSDLERDGFRIRWAIESVDRVLTLRFQLPLQLEIAKLNAESANLRGEIENLQQKTASLKEEIERKEQELAVAKKDMGKAELHLKEIANELETRGRLLAEYNTSILH